MLKVKGTRPDVRGEEAVWFEFCQEGRLMFQRCRDCWEAIFFPRSVCPSCLSEALDWEESSGRATVFTYTVQYRYAPEYADEPYAIAVVDLEEGVRMVTRLIADPATTRIGMPVQVEFASLEDGFRVPVFVEASAGG